MAPTRIMIIRHAEKPIPEGADGVTRDGQPSDSKSLSAIGWRRAELLAPFFANPSANHIKRPKYVFAASPDEESRRPYQTVTPLVGVLWPPDGVNPAFNRAHVKEDVAGEAAAVMEVDGDVLVGWEHTLIPALVNALPNPPATPDRWPGHVFGIVWILEASGGGWVFRQTPQMLMPDDTDKVIKFGD